MAEAALFADVRYYLSPTLSKQALQEFANILDVNEAEHVDRPQDATHVISNTDRFDGWESVPQSTIIVTPVWVERCVVLGRVQPAEYYSPNPIMIFSGIVACCADLTPADEEVISGTIIAMGGQYRSGLTRDVTHLFALSETTDRYQTAVHHQKDTRVIILVPHWFDDCVTLHRRLDPEPYTWPDPAVIRNVVAAEDNLAAEQMKSRIAATQVPEEKRSLFQSAMMEGKLEDPRIDYTPPNSVERDVWKGAKVLLSASLGLSPGRCQAVQAGIWRTGGTVLTSPGKNGVPSIEDELSLLEDADVLIAKYRQGWSYIKAVRAGKKIGTLAWVFHVETIGFLTEPTEQLLHYPTPSASIKDFSKHMITITNYTGEAREYLKRLIHATGAQFTPSMSQTNTVVLAAHRGGPKTERASTWNIPIVNHTWLEDCCSQWQALSPAANKYLLLPTGVDLSMQLGDAGVGRVGLDKQALLEQLDALEAEVGPLKPPEITEPKRQPTGKRSPKKKAKATAGAAETSVFVEQEMEIATNSQSTSPGLEDHPPRKKPARKRRNHRDPGSMMEVEGMLSNEVDSNGADLNEHATPPADVPGPSTTPESRTSSHHDDAAPLNPKSSKQTVAHVAKPRSTARKNAAPALPEEPRPSPSKRPRAALPTTKNRGKNKPTDMASSEEDETDNAANARATAQSASSPTAALADTSMSSQSIDANGRMRRGAAMRAEGKLKNDMEDLRNFESQRRRGVVIGSWEKNAEKAPATRKKRLSSGEGTPDVDEEEKEEEPQPKKRKTEAPRKGRRKATDADDADMEDEPAPTKSREASTPAAEYRVMTTQWDMSTTVGNKLKKLGVKIVDKEKECTHLVTQQMARTQKFLCALPTIKYLVSPDWVTESIKAQKLLNEDDFPIEDAKAKFGVTVADVLKRRDTSKGQLFHNHTFFLTSGLDDKLKDTMRSVILANGGKVSSQAPTARILEQDPNKHVVSCEADAKIWKPLSQHGHHIYDKEFVLSAALKQRMDMKDKTMWVKGSY